MAPNRLPRTQFDDVLLHTIADDEIPVYRNHGRQLLAASVGSTFTALAAGGARPILRLWRNRSLCYEQPLPDTPSAPCLIGDPAQSMLWISAGNSVLCASALEQPPQHVDGLSGSLQDALLTVDGVTILALRQGGALHLVRWDGGVIASATLDDDTGCATLCQDDTGELHCVYEKTHGIEYRRFLPTLEPLEANRIALPFGYQPVVLTCGNRVIVAYLGESWEQTDEDAALWDEHQRARRIGLGGYIAALVRENAAWRRFTLAQSRQFVKPLWPSRETFGYNYPAVDIRPRLDLFSAPALTVGPDGVPQVLWANTSRRWVYASRFLEHEFSPPVEVRGPLELLTGPCLTPRRVPQEYGPALPLALVTAPRVYLDALRLPERVVTDGRRIDFLQSDELMSSRGAELCINPMTRHPANPLMQAGQPGAHDASGVAAMVFRGPTGWHADILSKPNNGQWRKEFPAHSKDGLHWQRGGYIPDDATCTVNGESYPDAQCRVNFFEDIDEPNPDHRFKGFWMKPDTPWGAFRAVTSPDGRNWTDVPDEPPVMSDEDIVPWLDPHDIPERRYKALGNARSYCGRVCAQWTSPDGMHWHDRRDTIGFIDPFGRPPYWCQDYPEPAAGRILVEPWAGPDDEEEVHGGFFCRDGERWLLHYMKWTPDGHIIPALASSRDGIHYSRVAGGAPTLPLGEPGTWDSGRIATRNPPYLVDGVWRQYYTGSGWKHGQGGQGRRPHAGSPAAAAAAPMQTGIAEMPQGQWAYLRLRPETATGEIRTIAYKLATPHHLTLDFEGDTAGTDITCCVIDAATQRPLAGFDYDDCDTVAAQQFAGWRGKSLADARVDTVCIGVRFSGPAVRLFGLRLHPAA